MASEVEKMLQVMTMAMIKVCMFSSYEEHRNKLFVVLEKRKLSDRQTAEPSKSKHSVDVGCRVMRRFLEKKFREQAMVEEKELSERRRAETGRVLEKSE